MKKRVIAILASVTVAFVAMSCVGGATAPSAYQPSEDPYYDHLPFESPYAFGLDLSFVKRAEDSGRVFYDIDGTQKPAWQIFRDHGYNWARLLICNSPSTLGQDLDYVVEGAKKLKEYGYHFALDFMMSDGWANPMTQPMPSEWKDLTYEQRVQGIYDFVYNAISTLAEQDLMPEIVHVGNEIGNGMLWPDARIYYGDERKALSKWAELAEMVNAGSRAIRDVEGGDKVQIMIHVDFGGDIEMTNTYFDKMNEYNVDYDMIGFSFYPWSHGNLLDLRDNLYNTIERYHKPVIVIETGYYAVPSRTFDLVGIKSAFPESPEGQKQWFQAVNEIVMNAPHNLGRGVFWWEPMSRGRGFFDADGKAWPIVEAFEPYALPAVRADGNPRIWDFDEGERP